MRLFIGIRIPNDIQASLQRNWEQSDHPSEDMRVLEPESRHLTLAFLGEVSPDNRLALEILISKAMERPPKGSFSFVTFETFPPKAPIIITAKLDISDAPSWPDFVDRLRDMVSVAAPSVDRKPWMAHVTVARSRKAILPAWNESFDPIPWKPENVSLILSEPGSNGSRYTDLHVFPLDV
ncbi:MAG: RNA 2',3'-cyclic phosphodiesterase [Patescibacteria group bacterium]|jgi:2'-5' RNA ligase